VQLLGRCIDLNYLLAQHINNKIAGDLEALVRRFEQSEPTGIVEFWEVMKVLRATHEELSKHFDIDTFDSILDEYNECVGVGAFQSKLALSVGVLSLTLSTGLISPFVPCHRAVTMSGLAYRHL
jgi:hypothetical protein